MPHALRWLLLLGCFLAVNLTAAEIPDPRLRVLELALQDALDRGDNAKQAELSQPFRDGTRAPTELSPLASLLMGIALMDAPPRTLPFFQRALQDPALAIRARCWLAEAQLARRLPLVAKDIADELRKIAPGSPAISYVEGRIAWHLLLHSPPRWEARRQPLRERLTYYVKDCTGENARKHPHFDARFFSLGIDAAYVDTVILVAMQHALEMQRYRPRNATLTRMLLTVDRDLPAPYRKADLEFIEQCATLPPAEWARWQQRFRDYDIKEYVAAGHRLADESLGTGEGPSDLRANRMVLFFTVVRQTVHTWKDWLAAQKEPSPHRAPPPRGHPRFVELTLTFARLAADSRQPGFAWRAIEYLDTARVIDPTLVVSDEIELALSSTSRDFFRGVPFFVRELPQHLTDEIWLLRYLPIAELAPPEDFRRYVDALARANPTLSLVPLLTARARVTEEGALARYQNIFAGRPGAVQPIEVDWTNYRELLEEAAEQTGFLDGAGKAPNAGATFDVTVERWHQTAGYLATVAEQYALLLTRRAKTADTLQAYDAAIAASHRALLAGSQSVTIMRGLAEIQKLADVRQNRERQMAEQDRAIEAGLTKDRATVRKKIEQRQKARGEYIAWINERLRDLELDVNYGKAEGAQREKLRDELRGYQAIVKNYCMSCNAIGLQRNGEDCVPCGGSGKLNDNGPGRPAN